MMKVCFFFLFLGLFGSSLGYPDYEQQVARNPEDYRALYNAGVVAFKENKFERAQECFDIVTSPSASRDMQLQGEKIFYNKGNTQFKLQNYEEALTSFEKVLTFNPDNQNARKKIEHIRQLLEQKKEEEEQKQQENKDQQKNDQQNEHNDNQDQENQPENEQENKKNDKDSQDQEEKQSEGQQKDNDQKNNAQDQDTQGSHEKSHEDAPPQEDSVEKELTEQEKQILSIVQNLDEKMHEQGEKKKLQQAQGVVHARNNW